MPMSRPRGGMAALRLSRSDWKADFQVQSFLQQGGLNRVHSTAGGLEKLPCSAGGGDAMDLFTVIDAAEAVGSVGAKAGPARTPLRAVRYEASSDLMPRHLNPMFATACKNSFAGVHFD